VRCVAVRLHDQGHNKGAIYRATLKSACVAILGASVALAISTLLIIKIARSDNPSDDLVGSIEGDSISLQGPMTVEVVHGQIRTMLRSGNDIRVKSGQARLDLVEGGQIAICGPAHLSVLKSGGSLTVALDTGVLHAHIENKPTLIVYTAQIQAKPMSIGNAPQDALIGFESPGAMCVRASSGAVRLEQQLTAQNVIVPQGADVLVQDGRLENLQSTSSHCNCDVAIAAKEPQRAPELSRIATPEEIEQREAQREAQRAVQPKTPPPAEKKPPQPPALKEEPVYQVYMPPLSYDAKAQIQADNFDPNLILLVRHVRVRPTLIFQGRVEEAAPAVSKAETPSTTGSTTKPAASSTAAAPATQADNSVVNRVREFFRRLLS
jgi:hypothetical protein